MTERVLEGVTPLRFDSGHRFSPVGALTAVAGYLGRDAGYPWLMGLSGAAFRTCWSREWGLPMTYAAPEDLVATGARALGLRATTLLDADPATAWGRIVERLDAGFPVLTCGLAGGPEFGVLHGYRDEPPSLRVRSYFAEASADWVPFQPWIGWTYGGTGRFPLVLLEAGAESQELPTAALQRALRFARGEGPLAADGERRGLVFGLTAYGAWRGALEEVEGDLEGKAFNLALALNGLLDARRTASEFLQILAAVVPAWRTALARAAEHYRHEVAVLGQARDVLYFPPRETEEAVAQAARDLADPDRRRRYGAFLKAAYEEERLSLEWVERALEEHRGRTPKA